MFKIIEHDDGSSTVYCSLSGRVICSVPKKRDKPLGIGRPIPREVEPNLATQVRSVPNDSTGNFLNSFGINAPLQCSVRPLAWTSQSDGIITEKCTFQSENDLLLDNDIQEDCVSQPEFLQTLGLCPMYLKENNDWKNLRQELPTRLISRTSNKDEFYITPESKVYEECDIVSPLCQKWLKSTTEGQKYLIDFNQSELQRKKYEHFCRFALGSKYCGASPYSMRFRESKEYVSTYKPVKGRSFHVYCFNRRQRRERMIVLQTGLTKRSRKLKALCSQTEFLVNLKRLSKEQLETLTERSPLVLFERRPIIKHSRSVKVNRLPRNCYMRGRTIVHRSSDNNEHPVRECIVHLENIATKLLSAGLKLCNTDKYTISCLDANRLTNFSHNDHAYHRTRDLMPSSPKKLLPCSSGKNVIQSSNIKFLKTDSQDFATLRCHLLTPSKTSLSPSKIRVNLSQLSLPRKKDIPVIDLSSDEDEVASPPPSPLNDEFTQVVFHCYGCTFKNSYSSKKDGTKAIKDHMKIYHLVSQPNAFLSVQLEKAQNTAYVEAFPGYMH